MQYIFRNPLERAIRWRRFAVQRSGLRMKHGPESSALSWDPPRPDCDPHWARFTGLLCFAPQPGPKPRNQEPGTRNQEPGDTKTANAYSTLEIGEHHLDTVSWSSVGAVGPRSGVSWAGLASVGPLPIPTGWLVVSTAPPPPHFEVAESKKYTPLAMNPPSIPGTHPPRSTLHHS